MFVKASLVILSIGALVSVAGCATWTKPGASPVDRDAALASCRATAFQKLPPLMQTVQIAPAQVVPPQMNCSADNGQHSCTMTAGSYVPPVYDNQDQNEAGRASIVADCMYRDGWTR